MKKTVFVLVTAAILVFAFAATAMADTTSTVIPWAPAAPNNDPLPSTPHKGYAQNTTKCLVCHAVHKANAAGQVLLGATVASACNYCHVSTTGVSTKRVYNENPANFGTDTVFNHSNSCTECHAVHGAKTVDQSAYSSSILRTDAGMGIQAGLPTGWNVTSSGSDGPGALSAFCTQCHPYYTGTYADSDADGNVSGSMNTGGPYNSHIMTSDFAAYEPANGATKQGAGVVVAYASSAYCISCHDGGSNTAADSFPHMTAGAGFMKSSAFRTDGADAALTTTEDGVCLKCHRDTSATTGIGFDF